MVQVFRRHRSPYESARFALRALDPAATYALTELESGSSRTATGASLSNPGLPVAIPNQPGVAVWHYQRRAH